MPGLDHAALISLIFAAGLIGFAADRLRHDLAALTSCRLAKVSPSRALMPLAFASLLGGLAPLIGRIGQGKDQEDNPA